MGGPGSGRWYRFDKKATVEQCTTLSVTDLTRTGFLTLDAGYSGSLTWRYANGETAASIGITVQTRKTTYHWLHLRYAANGQPVAYKVELDSQPCNFGGVRWYMVCPLCGEQRVMKLHLPPGGRYFGCRGCHDLSYRSCQESDKRVSRLRRMEPWDLLRAVKAGEEQAFLALKALPDWVWHR